MSCGTFDSSPTPWRIEHTPQLEEEADSVAVRLVGEPCEHAVAPAMLEFFLLQRGVSLEEQKRLAFKAIRAHVPPAPSPN
jgi:hypothetical protein